MELKAIVESLIFASDKPLTLKQLKALTGNTKADLIQRAIDDIQAEFQASGIQLAEVGGGYQFRTHPDAAPWVKRLLAGRPPRLTQAMLETLAIIAYRQPITRPEIEDIRGVDCGGVIRLLLERSLVRIVGKKEEPGRPILYGTTRQFLEFFNLKDLSALPTLKEFTELSEEMAGELEAFDEGSGRAPDEAEVATPATVASEAAGSAAAEPPAAPAEVASRPPELTSEPPGPNAEPPELAPEPGPASPAPSEAAGDAAPAAAGTTAAEEAPTGEPEIEASTGEDAPSLEAESGAPDDDAISRGQRAPQTWARAGAAGPAAAEPEEDEDAALLALDRAMERVQGVLRAHQQAERARLQALLPDGAPEAPLPETPADDPPAPEASDDRPPEEL